MNPGVFLPRKYPHVFSWKTNAQRITMIFVIPPQPKKSPAKSKGITQTNPHFWTTKIPITKAHLNKNHPKPKKSPPKKSPTKLKGFLDQKIPKESPQIPPKSPQRIPENVQKIPKESPKIPPKTPQRIPPKKPRKKSLPPSNFVGSRKSLVLCIASCRLRWKICSLFSSMDTRKSTEKRGKYMALYI